MHRMTRHAITMVLVAIVLGVAAQAAETKYGAGVNIATATPIRYPPMRLAASVPMGNAGNSGLKRPASTQRSKAPNEAPAQMEKMDASMRAHSRALMPTAVKGSGPATRSTH